MRIDAEAPEALEAVLRARDWLPADATVLAVGRAGEGNMNRVLRVEWSRPDGSRGSGIAKQSSPVVEKYPDIPAPEERLLVEIDFYRLLADAPALAEGMPCLLGADESEHLSWIEDLGAASDFADRYGAIALAQADLDALLGWLSALHALPVDGEAWPRLRNRAMRALNHAHIFEIPFAEGAPDVDGFCAGLQAVAAPLRADASMRTALAALGEHYLADGSTLLHGDFYPGSWLATTAGPRVIDPEFGFLGCAEFDVGVLRAHLAFMGAEGLRLDAYARPAGFDDALADGFMGAELLRRLLGVAQLPVDPSLAQRARWLEQGRAAVLGR